MDHGRRVERPDANRSPPSHTSSDASDDGATSPRSSTQPHTGSSSPPSSPPSADENATVGAADVVEESEASSEPDDNTLPPPQPAQAPGAGPGLPLQHTPTNCVDAAATGHSRRTPTPEELTPPENVRIALTTWLDLISRPQAPFSTKQWVRWVCRADLSSWQPSGAGLFWRALQNNVAVAAPGHPKWPADPTAHLTTMSSTPPQPGRLTRSPR